MSKAPTLSDVSNILTSATTLNTNNDSIEEAFENTLSLDGSTPNAMGADLDMDSNDILNVGTLQVTDITVSGEDLTGILSEATTAAETATEQAVISATAAATATEQAVISETKADEAAASVVEAEVYAAEASLYGGVQVDTFEDLAGLTTSQISVGDYVQVKSLDAAYKCVASDGSLDYTGSGGLQWEVLSDDVRAFGAVGDYDGSTGTDDTTAIQLALKTRQRVYFPFGRYLISNELEVTTVGQNIIFASNGGYAYGENSGENWEHGTQVVCASTMPKRIRTRRLYRADATDPQDDPISVMFNVQAENVRFENACTWLECDYTDDSPTNYGSDCDVGFFVGTRVAVQFINCQAVGYFRKRGIWVDVTNQTGLPRFNDLNGDPYPTGSVENGADGLFLVNPHMYGPKQGMAILGAKPKDGETDYTDDYYDELLGSTVTDVRGNFGCSDVLCLQGRFYGPDHHSNYRWNDPQLDGGELNLTSLNSEPDDAACCIYIDGLAGNGNGVMHGMRFLGTRFATFEAFRVRLGMVARIAFEDCHFEGRDNGKRKDTSGNLLSGNDYTTEYYGSIASNEHTNKLKATGTTFSSLPHFYGVWDSHEVDTGIHNLSSINLSDNLVFEDEADIRAADGESVRLRSGNSTIMTVDSNSLVTVDSVELSTLHFDGDTDIRAAADSVVRFRVDDTTVLSVDGLGVASIGDVAVTSTVQFDAEADIRSGTGESIRFRNGSNTSALIYDGGAFRAYGTITGIVATTSQLVDITASVNTAGKRQGGRAWNSTTKRPVYSDGSSASDGWYHEDGTLAHVPV